MAQSQLHLSPLSTVMINTYCTSLHPLPPPVPPRCRAQEPVPRRPRSWLWFLSVIFAFHVAVTSGLFIYLLWKIPGAKGILNAEGTVAPLSGVGPYSGSSAVAHMKIKKNSPGSALKILQWHNGRGGSLLENVDYTSQLGALQVRIPGYYYVYAQVTFSKRHPGIPLALTIVKRGTSGDRPEEELLLKAFCSMNNNQPVTCTAYQGGMFRLNQGQQLSVNVTDLDLVHYDTAATTFGLFLLQSNS